MMTLEWRMSAPDSEERDARGAPTDTGHAIQKPHAPWREQFSYRNVPAKRQARWNVEQHHGLGCVALAPVDKHWRIGMDGHRPRNIIAPDGASELNAWV
jgi:hypothetical protein